MAVVTVCDAEAKPGEKRQGAACGNTGGRAVTKLEDNTWFLLMGILIGMEIAFWFWPDVDFYRTVWPALAIAMIGWYVIRRGGKNAR